MNKQPQIEENAASELRIYLALFGVFYAFFLLLTSLGTEVSFVPAGLEPRGVYHVLKIDGGDDAGYFAYLRSLFFDRDIDFFNEPYYIHRNRITETGYVFNQWKIGPGVLWLPFFLLAHWITIIYNWLGIPLERDGLSFVYFSSTALGSATLVYFGMILHYRILRNWFSRSASFWCVLAFFLATPLAYYTFIRNRMGHANDYFLVCLFVWTWLKFRSAPTTAKSVFLGLTGGLMILTRINSACFLILPLYDFCQRLRRQFKGGEKIPEETRFRHFIMLLACGLAFSPQVIVNGILSGETAGDVRTERVFSMILSPENWLRFIENPFNILFGANWGWFWHAPVYVFGAVGLCFFARKREDVGLPFALAISVPLFLAMIWPHHGIAYGYRHLLTVNLVFSCGAAWLFDRLDASKKQIFLPLVVLPLILWSYLQLCLFQIVVPYDTPQFVLQAFQSLKLFVKIPALLVRGENFFALVFHPGFAIKTYLDRYLLIEFPLMQLLIPMILLFTGAFVWDKMQNRSGSGWNPLAAANFILILFFLGLNVLILSQSDKKPFLAERKAEAAARAAREGDALAGRFSGFGRELVR